MPPENGYKINVIKGYNFNRELNVFKKYIDKIYKIKSHPINKTQKGIAKSLLNNLLGRFGITLDRAVTKILNEKSFDIVSSMNKVVSYKIIGKDDILATYVPRLDKNIIDSHDLDITKLLHRYKDNEVQSLSVSSVGISAAVTAYGRIHMCKLKLDILSKGGKIYYSDTDSIVTDIELPDNMVSPNELGKLKLEHNITDGIFISGKLYSILDEKGSHVIKAKGVSSKSLSHSDFINLYHDNNITGIRKQSKINWGKGDVKISDKNIVLNSDGYTKRSKIYSNKTWINTKPLVINTIDTALIPYNNKTSLILYNSKILIISYRQPYMFYITPELKDGFLFKSLQINSKTLVINKIDTSLIPYNNKTSLILYNNNTSLIPYNNKTSLMLYNSKVLSITYREPYMVYVTPELEDTYLFKILQVNSKTLLFNKIDTSLIPYNNKTSLILYNNKTSLILYNNKTSLILYPQPNNFYITPGIKGLSLGYSKKWYSWNGLSLFNNIKTKTHNILLLLNKIIFNKLTYNKLTYYLTSLSLIIILPTSLVFYLLNNVEQEDIETEKYEDISPQ